jgi:putative FmdB family regulatory protein
MGLKMPIYEFWCSSCEQKVSIYQQSFATISHSCPNCGNTKLERIFSPFSIRKTDKKVYEEIRSDYQFERALKRNDPRALAEWVTRTSRGDKVPAECEETIGKLAKGEWPTKNSKPSDDE